MSLRAVLDKNSKRKLVPPLNFNPVEHGLYRSGEPTQPNLDFLSTLHLKTVVWLAVEDPSDVFLGWIDDNDIEFEHMGLLTEDANPWDQLTDATIHAALEIILDASRYPILVCCTMGRHRTGTVIGCLRRIQQWSFASLIDEYQRCTGPKGERPSVELTIESFVPNLSPPPNPPSWFVPTARLEVAQNEVSDIIEETITT